MQIKRHYFMGFLSMLLSVAQAHGFEKAAEQSTFGDAPANAYLSFNQNKRLAASEGISFDAVLPTLKLGSSSLSGITRLNDVEQHVGLGLAFGRLGRLSVMAGQGEDFSRLSNPYSDLDPYYFHGGTLAPYRFDNVEWAYQFQPNLAMQFGGLRVEAESLDNRYAHYIGGQFGPIQANYIQIKRAKVKAGKAMSLSIDASFGNVAWSALKQAAGGEIQQLGVAFNSRSLNQYHLAYQSKHNPLLEDDRSSRIMFGFKRALGHGMQAASEKTQKQPRIGNRAVLGGAVVVAALALSSGSSSQDNNSRYAEQHAAGREVLNRINPRSVRENREYGGWVYQTPDNRYTSTTPVKGDVASVHIPLSLIPAGGRAAASYHTHGGNDPRYINEQFSFADIAGDDFYKVDGYLATPGGSFLWHNHRESRVVRLGSIAN